MWENFTKGAGGHLRDPPPQEEAPWQCCHTVSPPVPTPRFHNGRMLARRELGSGAHLELSGLSAEQAGVYHCQAWSQAGTVRSGTAQLTVLGELPDPTLSPSRASTPIPMAPH